MNHLNHVQLKIEETCSSQKELYRKDRWKFCSGCGTNDGDCEEIIIIRR